MSMMLGLYTKAPSDGGILLLDATSFTDGAQFSTNEHGYEALPATIRRPMAEAFRFFDQSGTLYAALACDGSIVWEGRLEDPAVFAGNQGSGLKIQALGAWRAFTDAPYTALWSMTKVENYIESIGTYNAAYAQSERWQRDTNNRLFIALVKNTTYTLNQASGLLYFTPSGSSRDIIGIQFALEINLPAQFTARCVGFNETAPPFSGGVVHTTLVGTGALVNRAYHLEVSANPRDIVGFDVLCNTGVLYAAETAASYAKVTQLRIVSSSTNRVNTTLTANRAAGASVTATVGSTSGMYAGMALVMNSGNNPSEIVTVESVTNSTQFVATFVGNYVIGNAVQGFRVTADEIAKDLVAVTNALNSTQLSSSTALIQSPGVDLTDEVYEDQFPADILTHLTALGDNQTTPRQWEACVWEGRTLAFRPRGDAARAWYVDVTDLSIARTLEDLANSVYAVYQDASGRTLRTAANTDSASVTRYGITRRQSLSVDTTSSIQAGVQRDAQLADHKDPLPRATVAFEAVYDAVGSRNPLWMVRSGDTVTIRNLPPSISTTVNRITTFRISHTTYNLMDRTLEIELEVPPPRLATLLARRAEGIR